MRTLKRWGILHIPLGFLLCLAGSEAASGAGDFSLSGYYKSYLYLYQPPSVNGAAQNLSSKWLSTNRFRLHLSYQPRNWMGMDAAYDLVPRMQSANLFGSAVFFGQVNPFVFRAVDLNPHLHPTDPTSTDNFVLDQNLDRAAVSLHTKPADITIGRQAIAWGSARVINPTDVLAPFTFQTLDTEDRVGIDAVRTRISLGALSEIDAGYVFGRDFEFKNSAFYGRTKFNARKTDVALTLMGFRENLLTGFDMARAIGNAGFWLETAYVFVDAFAGTSGGRENDYFRASTGLDYNFNSKTYAFIEYHFNGAGAAIPRDYVGEFSTPAYTEGAVYLMGRNYLIPGVTYQISPLVTFTAESLINLNDPSVYVTPQVDYNISSNFYIGAGAFIGIGQRPMSGPEDNTIVLRSEFGGYPNIYYGALRYYF